MQLRDYQYNCKADVYREWESGSPVVALVLPTGAGKTVIFADIVRELGAHTLVMAHRQELVGQISMALATCGIYHDIMAPKSVIGFTIGQHRAKFSRDFFRVNSKVVVASVNTLHARKPDLSRFQYWITDECHHVLRENIWGKVLTQLPNARGLGVTATLCRADGAGLGRHADGLIDTFVEGPKMRELINRGYLTDYDIAAPESDMDVSDVNVTKTGDFNPQKLKAAALRSHIVGDVVSEYLKFAKGKKGVTFATDVETAGNIAQKFRENDVNAECVSAKTPDAARAAIFEAFRVGEIMQLVNVDIVGEGFDLPAIEVVSMARPTQSLCLHDQQFGRGLRPMPGKDRALIIDHVGNVILRHGVPDRARVWTLDRRERRSRQEKAATLVKACPGCSMGHESYLVSCPYCGHTAQPTERSKPEFVEGDLTMLTPEAIAKLRGELQKVQKHPADVQRGLIAGGVPPGQASRVAMNHSVRMETHKALVEEIAQFGAWDRHMGLSDRESYRKFYQMFGVDVLSAQTLSTADARILTERVRDDNNRRLVV